MLTQSADATITLNVSTLFVLVTCICGLVGFVLLGVWRQERIRALAWWGAAYLIGGFAVALWSLGSMGVLVPAPMPTAFMFLACGLIWTAARVFHGRPVLWVAMSAGAWIWVAMSAVPGLFPLDAYRGVATAAIVLVYSAAAAQELWRERRRALIRRWPALFVPVLHGLAFVTPLPLAALVPNESGLVAFAAGWFALVLLEVILYVVGIGFIVATLRQDQPIRVRRSPANIDPLTNVFNRRAFFEGATQLRAAQARRDEPVAALMFDLDHFKSINDGHGHFVGDEVLRLFAATLSTSLRSTDLVARFGGEEFVALLPGSADDGAVAAERVRAVFEEVGRQVGARSIGATVSVGVASASATADLAELLTRADIALYRAKAQGRNRVARAIPGETFPGVAEPAFAPPVGGSSEGEARQAEPVLLRRMQAVTGRAVSDLVAA